MSIYGIIISEFGEGGDVCDMGEIVQTVTDFLSKLWVEYRIGTAFALISMVMVFTVDAKLVKAFLQAGNRLKEWPKLLGHTAWRVLWTVVCYYGPVWTVQQVSKLLRAIAKAVYDFFMFITSAPRFVVIFLTTSVVVLVFLVATGVALWQYLRPKFKVWKLMQRAAKGPSLFERLAVRPSDAAKRRELELLEAEVAEAEFAVSGLEFEPESESDGQSSARRYSIDGDTEYGVDRRLRG